MRIAAGELADQRNIHAAYKAHGPGLGGHRRHHAHEVRPLLFGEDHRFHVRLIDNHVNDREFGVREVRRNLCQRVAKGKARHHDRVGASLGQTAQRLFALGFGLHFKFLVGAAGFGGPTLRALIGCLVEGFVELAAKIEDQGGIGGNHASRQGQRRGCGRKVLHKGHLRLPVVFLRPHDKESSARVRAAKGDRFQIRAGLQEGVNS